MELSEYCTTVCETLKSAIQGKNTGDLDESERVAVEKLEKCVHHPRPFPLTILNDLRAMLKIERTLRRGASTPHTRYNKEKIENHVQEVQQLLASLNAQSSPPGENLCAIEHGARLTPDAPDETVAFFAPNTGALSALHWRSFTEHRLSFPFLNPNTAACGHAFALHELPSMIDAIFSGKDRDDTICRLPGDDPQCFIDVIDEVRPSSVIFIGVNTPLAGTE